MKQKTCSNAASIIGAVIGAGFASGREIVVFFSRYGTNGWLLAGITVATMTGLCWLCMKEASPSNSVCWCCLFDAESQWVRTAAQLCVTGLLTVMGGSMISAAGQMVALTWSNEWAYSLGALGTMAAAWFMGCGNMKPMNVLSAVLTSALIVALALAWRIAPSKAVSVQMATLDASALIRAVAYAAMNMTLAMGVACRCAGAGNRWTAAVFGGAMALLTGCAHALYSAHPQWLKEAFPLVKALNGYGRAGFLISAGLLYLAILTSLTAVLDALHSAFARMKWPIAFAYGLPLAVSLIGFEGIVEHVYAPVGLMCLLVVFMPLVLRQRRT